MSAKVDAYHQLLLEISPSLDASTQARIRRAIEKVGHTLIWRELFGAKAFSGAGLGR